jgi:hypothetical protein
MILPTFQISEHCIANTENSINLRRNIPDKSVQAVMLLTYIREVTGSNLGRYTDYPEWCIWWFSSVPPSNFYDASSDFVSHSSEFIIQFHPITKSYIVRITDSLVKFILFCLSNYAFINAHLWRLMVGCLINWKGFARKLSWPKLRYHPGTCLEGVRKTTRDLTQANRCPDRDSNLASPEYKPTALPLDHPALKQLNKYLDPIRKINLQNAHLN